MSGYKAYRLSSAENGFIIDACDDAIQWVFTSRYDTLVFLAECMLKMQPEGQSVAVEIRKIAYDGDAPAAK